MPHAAGASDVPKAAGPAVTHQNPVSTRPVSPRPAQTPATPVRTKALMPNPAVKPVETPAASLPSQNHAIAASETRINSGNDRVSVDKPRQPLTIATGISKPVDPRTGPAKVVLQAPFPLTPAMGMGSPKKVSGAGAANINSNNNSVPMQKEPPNKKASFSTMVRANAIATAPVGPVANMISTGLASSGISATATTASNPPILTTRPIISVPSSSITDPTVDAPLTAEQKLEMQRRPLTNLYGSVLVPQDTCLADARKRLETAIEQTNRLRQAFTSRVYEKYRVCLKPPPTADVILKSIRDDPLAASKSLDSEIERVREDKEIEKKELQALSGEINASDNVDHLMYITAGLNAVVLPEAEMPEPWAASYPERGPINMESGNRSKGISQAAATAGELTLDRTRRAIQLHAERQRRKQLRRLSGEDSKSSFGNPSTSISLTNGATGISLDSSFYGAASRKSKSKAAVAALKPSTTSNRGRGASAIPASVLLGLNPAAEQMSNQSSDIQESAAMAALRARGTFAPIPKAPQHRLRHPHPESMGGRRRASSNQKKESSEHFPEAFLSMTLPPLPATKERLERKPLHLEEPNDSAPDRAKKAVRDIVGQFIDDEGGMKDTTKIRLLHSLRQITNENSVIEAAANKTPTVLGPGEPPSADTPLDPVIAFCVLHSVGLVGRSNLIEQRSDFELPKVGEDFQVSKKLKELHGRLCGSKRTLSNVVMSQSFAQEKRPADDDASQQHPNKKRKETEKVESQIKEEETSEAVEANEQPEEEKPIPVMNLRGGGDESVEGSSEAANVTGSTSTKTEQAPAASKEAARTKAAARSAVGQTSTQPIRSRGRSTSDSDTQRADAARMAFLRSQLVGGRTAGAQIQGYLPSTGSINALQLSTQLQGSPLSAVHHPAGDLASAGLGSYLGSLGRQQNPYDIASFMPGTTAPQAMPSFAALGLGRSSGLLGYTLEEREATARAALYAREQQTAALLQSGAARFQQSQSAPFRHQAAMNALLGQSQYTSGQLQTAMAQGLYTSTPSVATDTAGMPPTGEASVHKKPSEPSKPASNPPRQAKRIGDGGQAPQQSQQQDTKKPGLSKPVTEVSKEDETPAAATKESKSGNGTRIQYFDPKKPSPVGDKYASLIKAGRFYEVVSLIKDTSQHIAALNHLTSLGVSVPIPKALIVTPLKERLSASGIKSSGGNGPPPIPRETVASAIMVWLWANHESNFQRAFDKSGRMDVDPECKWLIQAAIDTSFRELSKVIADSMARNQGPFAEAAAARKSQMGQKQGGNDADKLLVSASINLQIHTATVVSRALMTELRIDPSMNFVLGNFQGMVEYLDEARLCALRIKAQERVLLAALVSRKATMTESFSHAYASSMVRAGEALGHENLFECVQNEPVQVSTMLPYDIFSDANESWEDPCRPAQGFTPGVGAEQLMRRAHARAMIQKSLKRLQDKNHIRGGTLTHGPYTDPSTSPIFKPAPAPSPRPGKRRLSVIVEPPVPPGTGSAPATSIKQYDPGHASEPLNWDSGNVDNTPYGRFSRSERVRSVSLSLSARTSESKAKKLKRGVTHQPLYGTMHDETEGNLPRGTYEIAWGDVAGIFSKVELPKKAIRAAAADSHAVDYDAQIFAPYCSETNGEQTEEDEESDSEEKEFTEAEILARHHDILDAMKQKLNSFLEARKQQQERRRKK